ncbi:hypothetical protein HYX02_03550 [Candidatus Woesearchaeota archaeon]|nr:hypothetical protein [Candidatus Woesearchaeota archaeon]
MEVHGSPMDVLIKFYFLIFGNNLNAKKAAAMIITQNKIALMIFKTNKVTLTIKNKIIR